MVQDARSGLIRHAAVYTAAKLLPGLLGMVTTGVLTRLLAPSSYGIYGLALVVMTLGSTMAFDWLGVAFLRFYQARPDDPRAMATFLHIFMILAGATAIIYILLRCAGLCSGTDHRVYEAGMVMMWSYCLVRTGFPLRNRTIQTNALSRHECGARPAQPGRRWRSGFRHA